MRSRTRVLLLAATVAVALVAWFVPQLLGFWGRRQAESSLAVRDPQRALEWLDYSARFRPETAGDHFMRARIHRKLGDVEEFLATLELARDAGYDRERIRREQIYLQAQGGRLSEVESELPTLLIEPDGDGAEICEAFANGYITNYRIDEATILLDVWEQDYPDDPQVYFLRGRLEEHKGNWEAAVTLYQQSLNCRPGYGPAAYNMARVLLMQKKPEAAIPYYQQTADWLVNDTPALVGMAHSYRLLDQADAALQVLKRADAEDPATVARSFRLVGEMSDASSSAVAGERGQIELAAGRFEDAVRSLKQAVEANPRDHTLRYLLARALRGTGQSQEADEHFNYYEYEEATQQTRLLDQLMEQIRADPEDAQTRFEIGRILLEYVSENQGLVWLNSALRVDPGHQPTHRQLAAYHESLAHQSSDPQQAKTASRLARQHREQLRTPIPVPTTDDATAGDEGA